MEGVTAAKTWVLTEAKFLAKISHAFLFSSVYLAHPLASMLR